MESKAKKNVYSSNEKLNIIYSALLVSFERISNILRNSPGGLNKKANIK